MKTHESIGCWLRLLSALAPLAVVALAAVLAAGAVIRLGFSVAASKRYLPLRQQPEPAALSRWLATPLALLRRGLAS